MSFSFDNVEHITVTLGAGGAATGKKLLFRADQKVTIKNLQLWGQATGTANTYQIENWGTAGTSIKAGTSGTVVASVSGTALVAATPLAATLVSSAAQTIASGEYVVLNYTKSTGDTFPEKEVTIHVEYVRGVGV